MSTCPCGSGKTFNACCEPYILGKNNPPTAEALMRSRYSAYATQAIDYIIDTCISDGKRDIDREQTRRWSADSTWLGLKILSSTKGGPNDSEGTVEFIASSRMNGLRDDHRENASFKKVDGKWMYDDGSITPTTIVRDNPKQGRNEPCACGSGRKYKHCCGK